MRSWKPGTLRAVMGACLLLALAIVAPGCEPRAEGGGVKLTINLSTRSYVLPNGLQVFLQPDHREPYVHVRMQYDVGSKDDPKGRAGLAHLYEHLMFAAAKHMKPDAYLTTLDRIGATEFNGTTEDDVTTYFETVPRGALEIALFLEAERMGFAPAAVTKAQLERERRIVREEYRQRWFNEPYGLVFAFVRKGAFPADHPYARGVDDRDAETGAITEDDVKTFGDTYYVPNDARLVVVGDFDEEAVATLVAKYFASIPAGTKSPPSPKIAPVVEPRVHTTDLVADVQDDEVVLGWVGPAWSDDGFREHKLAAGLLAGYTGGRLRRKDDQLSKTGTTWSQDAGCLGTLFTISMKASGKGSLDDLVDAYEYTQRWMREADTLDLGDEKSSLLVHGLFGIESTSDRADRIVDYERRLGSPDAVMTDLRAYQSIERSRVLRAIAETFTLSRATIVRVHKDPSAPVSGKLR